MSFVSTFDFVLPPALIAQEPRPRGRSRLLVVDRARGTWQEHTIADLPALLTSGDVIVGNDTQVFPARLIGRRDPSGGTAECLLLERVDGDEWDALVHPGQKLKPGARLVFEDAMRAPGLRITAEVLEQRFFGRRRVRLAATSGGAAADVDAAVDRLGHVPLPPYIHRADRDDDRERYQTVYAAARGSIAAPTAGLHFDAAIIDRLRAAAIAWSTITLHVGYGTFKPVRVDRVEDHVVDPEQFAIDQPAVDAMRAARAAGRRRAPSARRRRVRWRARWVRTVSCRRAPASRTLFIHRSHVPRGGRDRHGFPSAAVVVAHARRGVRGRELVLAAYRTRSRGLSSTVTVTRCW